MTANKGPDWPEVNDLQQAWRELDDDSPEYNKMVGWNEAVDACKAAFEAWLAQSEKASDD